MDEMEQLAQGEGKRVDGPEAEQLIKEPGLVYFGNRLCPYAHRTFWAARELGYDKQWTYIHVDLGTRKPGWYTSINPLGTVPCLYDNGRPVFESLILAEYINDVAGGSLVPSAPLDKATMRFIIARFADSVGGALFEAQRNKDPAKDETLLGNVQTKLAALDQLYAHSQQKGGPYLFGSSLSLAEIAIAPFLERSSIALKEFRGYDVFADGRLPALHAMITAVRERPAFQHTTGTQDYFLTAFKGYMARGS